MSVSPTPQSATLSSVNSANTNTKLWDADPGSVHGRIIFNESTAILNIKFGTTASATSYTVQVPAGGSYAFPAPVYSGQVDGIWVSANGAARLTQW